MYGITLQFAESAPPDQRDHGVVLAAREGLDRVQALLGGQADQQVRAGGKACAGGKALAGHVRVRAAGALRRGGLFRDSQGGAWEGG